MKSIVSKLVRLYSFFLSLLVIYFSISEFLLYVKTMSAHSSFDLVSVVGAIHFLDDLYFSSMHMFTEKACRTGYAEPSTNGWNIRTSTRSKTYPRNPSKAKWICGKLQRCLWGYFVNSTGQIYPYVSIWRDGVDVGIGEGKGHWIMYL